MVNPPAVGLVVQTGVTNLISKKFEGKKVQTFKLNGENLDGWKVYGTEKWYVEDGVLICESGEDKEYGYLGTEKSNLEKISNLLFCSLSQEKAV